MRNGNFSTVIRNTYFTMKSYRPKSALAKHYLYLVPNIDFIAALYNK